jgi:hypothetical protein
MRSQLSVTYTRLFQDLAAAEESAFTFRLRLAERDSEAPFGNSLTSKRCERKCVKFALVQDEVVSGSKGRELTSCRGLRCGPRPNAVAFMLTGGDGQEKDTQEAGRDRILQRYEKHHRA